MYVLRYIPGTTDNFMLGFVAGWAVLAYVSDMQ